VIIRWDFPLHKGQCFTDRRYATLLESAKLHLALLRTRSSRARPGCSATTLRVYFQCLRAFIRWMIVERCRRFSDLDAALLEEFICAVKRRRGRSGPRIASETFKHYCHVLSALYRHRHLVTDGLQVDPFPAVSLHAATVGQLRARPVAPYTPDEIAVPLIQGAIEFLGVSALPILAARERYRRGYAEARPVYKSREHTGLVAMSMLKETSIDTPRGPYRLETRARFARLIDLLYGACFVLISYLVGPRVSELLHLKAGCIQTFTDPGSDLSPGVAMIVGAIYKLESYHGRQHQWVAPSPALHAITVLEALSEPHRARSGRDDLWQRPRIGDFGLREWLGDSVLTMRISDTKSANERVNRFAIWLKLPAYKGRRWRFSSHQGRRTFTRFVALRDRTGLHALAQHLGHRDVRHTDRSYVPTDYQLQSEIEAAVRDQSISAWEQMLSARALGGRMGTEVLARRPRFRGGHARREIRAYARMLAGAGLTLGVCDWGFCVYREEVSACRGSVSAPDPVRREPSTCVRCKNFAASDAHRPYWIDQADRYAQLLNDPNLPAQTLKIARTRLEEARSLIQSMGGPRGQR
jgi:integrase